MSSIKGQKNSVKNTIEPDLSDLGSKNDAP